MNKSSVRSLRRVALSACALAALAVPSVAEAKQARVDLQVEAAGRTLAAGGSYLTDTASIATDTSPACGGSGAAKTIQGPTALGTLIDGAATTEKLRPLGVSDKFSFGLLVCRIGGVAARDDAFWLYKVNHRSPEVGADQQPVRTGDDVLWYLQDTSTGHNTGDELALSAPARAEAGTPFRVTVTAYDSQGRRRPAANAVVRFPGGSARTDANGIASVRIDEDGTANLRAVRGIDIASPRLSVCVAEELRRCSPVRGKRIVGTPDGERITGTRGPDRVLGHGGADRINVSWGRRDRVRCGGGQDRVHLGPGDRAYRDCEIVTRRKPPRRR